MRDERSNTLLYAGVVVIGAACAAIAGLALSQVATPPEFAARLAGVDAGVGQLETAAKMPAPRVSYGREAMCKSADPAEIAAIQQRIGQAANAAGVSVGAVTLTPVETTSSRLAPLELKLEASGPYAGVVNLLSSLGSGAPSVFVDRLDLRQSGGGVQLTLSSKVYCWNDARS